MPTEPGVAEAATNNAEWCDAVARSHGIAGAFAADAWTAPARTPPLYPDAVTLGPDVDARALLDRIDDGPGASIKDSFASLDLGHHGFSVLFDATWIVRARGTGALIGDTAELTRVDTSTFAAWEAAWRGEDGPADVLRAAVLDDPRVTVLATTNGDGDVVGGLIAHATTAAIGVSNMFAPPDGLDALWRGVVAWTELHAPNAPLVGYESGTDLAAWRIGFEPIAPLRVWSRDR